MPTINLASDLVEVDFSPEELNTAQQLMDKNLSIMLLQNTRVALVRQLAAFTFSEDPTKLQHDFRVQANLSGQLDMLDGLIHQAYNPTPIPEKDPSVAL